MSYKILLIDDSMTQLEMLRLQFAKAGFDVVTASDGSEGYQKVFETVPDLVLSDIVMPNLNGYQLCRLLKNDEITKQIPVVLLTVLDKKIDKFWGNKSGADKFLSKTTSFDDIHKSVLKIIENHPVADGYKKVLINKDVSDDTIQNQVNSILDELLMNSTFLNEFRDLGEFIAHEKVLVEKTFKLLGSFVDYNIAGLFFNNMDKNEKNMMHIDINKSSVSSFVVEKVKRDFFSAMPMLKSYTIREFGHDIVREKVDNAQKILMADEFKTSHYIPLISDGILLGGLCFFNVEECDYADFKFYRTMVNELLVLFKMRYLHSETEYLSVTDGLTGLYNRRHFNYNIEREYLRTKRYPSDLSLALIDIDFFKNVNDTFGHQFGDYVLREISGIIEASFRKTDMIYRYGGEEIAVILTETVQENASIPLERLREKIAQHKFVYNGEETNITVSIGVSSNCAKSETLEEFIEYVDKALYEAKQEGRNRVVAYSDEQTNKILY